MRITTIGDLADAITAQIRGLVPAEVMQRARTWRPVDDIDAVQGGEIRTFYVDIPPESVRPYPSGYFSPSSIEHEAQCLVYTSYANLKRRDHRRLAAGDGRQVWLAIDVLRDAETVNTIAGLVAFDHTGWQPEDDDQGRQWGAHTFAVRVLLSGIPGAT
jgi:hypothetical protein